MILTVNAGNTNITLAGYSDGHLTVYAALHTDPLLTADEYALRISQLLTLRGSSADAIEGSILGSVVPALNNRLLAALRMLSPARVLTVGPGLKSGIRLCLDDPSELGSDLLCGVAAALEECPGPLVTLCADTALSMMAATAKREIVGGVIVSSPRLAMQHLTDKAAQLPQIDLRGTEAPAILGKNTADCLKSGILLGTAAQIDGLAEQFRAVLGPETRFFVTGDLPQAVFDLCKTKLEIRPHLISDGLYLLYKRNRRG